MTDENNIAALNNERLAKIWNPGNVKMQTRNCKLQFAVCGFEWKTSCQRSLLSWSKLSARKNNPFGVYLLLWVFSKLPTLQYYFPESFRCNLPFHERENFSDHFYLHYSFESENFRFPFFYEKQLNFGSEMWKIKL